jgi:predicted PurR-regulated permease PerM
MGENMDIIVPVAVAILIAIIAVLIAIITKKTIKKIVIFALLGLLIGLPVGHFLTPIIISFFKKKFPPTVYFLLLAISPLKKSPLEVDIMMEEN